MEEAAELADRVTVLSRGSSVLDGAPSAVFGDRERLAGLGLAAPPALRFVEQLESRGVGLDGAARSGRLADLVDAVERAVSGGAGAGGGRA
jgi:ABC-type multidrug transport system ATPase subunit